MNKTLGISLSALIGLFMAVTPCSAAPYPNPPGSPPPRPGQPAPGQTPPKLSFGLALNRELRAGIFETQDRVLDLDDGRLLTVSTNLLLQSINNPRPLIDWMLTQGADLFVRSPGGSPVNLAFHLYEGRLVMLGTNVNFESVSAPEVLRLVARSGGSQVAYVAAPAKGPGATLAFRTREGGMGVLQVVSFAPKPHASVKIRYKLVQGLPAQPERPRL